MEDRPLQNLPVGLAAVCLEHGRRRRRDFPFAVQGALQFFLAGAAALDSEREPVARALLARELGREIRGVLAEAVAWSCTKIADGGAACAAHNDNAYFVAAFAGGLQVELIPGIRAGRGARPRLEKNPAMLRDLAYFLFRRPESLIASVWGLQAPAAYRDIETARFYDLEIALRPLPNLPAGGRPPLVSLTIS